MGEKEHGDYAEGQHEKHDEDRGHFSEGQEREHKDREDGHFSEGQEKTPPHAPEKEHEGGFSEGQREDD